ncbi:MAG: hypothetical protein LBV69_10855, partial [Bacteroidales bacterium]|nr:hypothetical protein [Bacteroidales bacterium]
MKKINQDTKFDEEELREKITELSACNTTEQIIQCLQEINKIFLENYDIKINDIVVEPLQVETYYDNEKQNFRDKNIHHAPEQKNNFGKLYLHKKVRGGIYICLSDSDDFYLSLLIKTSRIGTEYFTQTE